MSTTLNLSPCFQYTNPLGDLVVKATTDDYVQMIGSKVCSIAVNLNTQSNLIAKMSTRVLALEQKQPPVFTIPSVTPIGIADPNTPIPINDFVSILEKQFVDLRGATGDPQNIYLNITKLPNNINDAKALGTSGGKLSSLSGWTHDIKTLADAVGNLFVMLIDLRSGVRNVQLAAGSLCDSVEVLLTSTLQSKTLKLFFTGSIPDSLGDCITSGSMFKIEDASGNFVNYNINVKPNLNVVTGLSLDLSGTPLNFADDFRISGILSLCDPDSGNICQKHIDTLVSNTSACPTMSITSNYTSINYNFNHVTGTVTYSVQIFNINNVMIQSRNISVSTPTNIVGSFDNLDANTAYKVRLQIITANSTKSCPFTNVSTLPTICPAPNSVNAIIQS